MSERYKLLMTILLLFPLLLALGLCQVSSPFLLRILGAFWAGLHPWLFWGLMLILFIVLGILSWNAYVAVAAHRRAQQEHVAQIEERKLRLELEKARYELEAHRFIVPSGSVAYIHEEETGGAYIPYVHAALPRLAEKTVDADPPAQPLPKAPPFRYMMHLNTKDRMVLCYIIREGQSVPAYGTIKDLLSMAIIGKPGRGKTTAIMYYVCMLLQAGAEVWIFDPHGVMRELHTLHNKPLARVPSTAQVRYFDRREDIIAAIPELEAEFAERDELYRETRQVKHPLMLLGDELGLLAEWDDATARTYKAINAQRRREGEEELAAPLAVELIKRFVTEFRKWEGYFIGSSQTIDAEILPTRVTDALSSRIVFFSSERKARLVGLEKDAIEDLLPQIRRADSGTMIFDCARWDEPVIGAIPFTSPEDMIDWLLGGVAPVPEISMPDLPKKQLPEQESGLGPGNLRLLKRTSGPSPDESQESGPDLGPDDYRFTQAQEQEFIRLYMQEKKAREREGDRRPPAVKDILRLMRVGNRYAKYAAFIIQSKLNGDVA